VILAAALDAEGEDGRDAEIGVDGLVAADEHRASTVRVDVPAALGEQGLSRLRCSTRRLDLPELEAGLRAARKHCFPDADAWSWVCIMRSGLSACTVMNGVIGGPHAACSSCVPGYCVSRYSWIPGESMSAVPVLG
jgi:hypothetical protein